MIREAAERIRPIARRTPVLTSRSFNEVAGVRAFFKCENFQTGGAFKIRGASNLVFSLDGRKRWSLTRRGITRRRRPSRRGMWGRRAPS